jgi:hypothetical protein
VGRLETDNQLYRFWYTAGARKPGFRAFPGMDSLDEVYKSEELSPLFANPRDPAPPIATGAIRAPVPGPPNPP